MSFRRRAKLASLRLKATCLRCLAWAVRLASKGPQATSRHSRFLRLPKLAWRALERGQPEAAAALSAELLALAAEYQGNWNYGNAVHLGHTLLGLAHLRQGRLAEAREHLLASAETPGSPQLGSFGPNMSLARELLLAGEREAVLEYLRRCAGFWKRGASRLEGWRSAVEAGKMPDFGANLNYGKR